MRIEHTYVNRRKKPTTWLHIVLGLPFPLTPSTSYEVLFFTQSPSSFHNTSPNHLNWFHFTTSDTNSIYILSLSSALCPSEIHHTSIVPSSSLSTPILHSDPHSFPISHFHTPSHPSHTPSLNFSFKDTSFLAKISDNSLNFLHPPKYLSRYPIKCFLQIHKCKKQCSFFARNFSCICHTTKMAFVFPFPGMNPNSIPLILTFSLNLLSQPSLQNPLQYLNPICSSNFIARCASHSNGQLNN